MAITLPTSPAVADIITIGGTRFQWNGTTWAVMAASVPPPQYHLQAIRTAPATFSAGYNIDPCVYDVVLTAECRGGAETTYNAATGVFTIPADGIYEIAAGFSVFRGANTDVSLVVIKNSDVIAVSGGFYDVNRVITVKRYFSASDTIQLATRGNVSGTRVQSAETSFLTITYVSG